MARITIEIPDELLDLDWRLEYDWRKGKHGDQFDSPFCIRVQGPGYGKFDPSTNVAGFGKTPNEAIRVALDERRKQGYARR